MRTPTATRPPKSRLAVLPSSAHCPALALMLLAACADGTRSAPTAPGAPHAVQERIAGAAAPARPIRGRCESVHQPIPLPFPPQFAQRVTGTCQLSHLGRVTVEFVQVIDFTTWPVTVASTDLAFTAANGDVLRAPGGGVAFPNAAGFAVSGTYRIAGGTGRFSGATGYLDFTGQAALPAFTAEITLEGEIAYAASDRSGR